MHLCLEINFLELIIKDFLSTKKNEGKHVHVLTSVNGISSHLSLIEASICVVAILWISWFLYM